MRTQKYSEMSEKMQAETLVALASIMEGTLGIDAIYKLYIKNTKFKNPSLNNHLKRINDSIEIIFREVSSNLNIKPSERVKSLNLSGKELSEEKNYEAFIDRPTSICRILNICTLLSTQELESLANELEKPFT